MQSDGNLVVYAGGGALWQSGSAGNPGASVTLQSDGNLVVYAGGRAHRRHLGRPSLDAGDGNLVLYDTSGRALWQSGTRGTNRAILDVSGALSVIAEDGGVRWSSRPGATARATALARAAHWLTAKNGGRVPYSRDREFEGYRTDCFGYVSMALELSKSGPNTEVLATIKVTKPIAFADQLPGTCSSTPPAPRRPVTWSCSTSG